MSGSYDFSDQRGQREFGFAVEHILALRSCQRDHQTMELWADFSAESTTLEAINRIQQCRVDFDVFYRSFKRKAKKVPGPGKEG
mmetsp:Transcript_30645/g.73624  ORF Transcript_30645/g.73624 Transcript_30645/m.73624 type:complete len:84 (-) Transcript_30645:80-331(-)